VGNVPTLLSLFVKVSATGMSVRPDVSFAMNLNFSKVDCGSQIGFVGKSRQ
jgi:hypothetical protein